MPRKLVVTCVAVASVFGLVATGSIGAEGFAGQRSTMSATDAASYVVVFRDGVDAKRKAHRYGVTPTFTYGYALSGFAAVLTPEQQSWLRLDRDVLMIAPADRDAGGAMAASSSVISTPIEDIPQGVPNRISRIGADRSRTARIDGIDQRVPGNVAVLDTGIDSTQPDLNVAGGVNCGGPGSTGFDDENGHGTFVAGVLGALDNSFGTVGVAPGVRLWSVRVFNDEDIGNDSTVLCGLDWVDQHRRVIEVANMSLEDTGSDDGRCGLANNDPVHWAICHVVRDGVTVVAGAGNDGMDASQATPAAYAEVITVSGFADTDGQPGGLGPESCLGDADDTFSFFSNFGAPVDVSAPDECLGSTLPGGGFGIDSGTSYSTALVSGAAALYLARHPGIAPRKVRKAILSAAEPGPIAGDPDNEPEGVLDVSQFSLEKPVFWRAYRNVDGADHLGVRYAAALV